MFTSNTFIYIYIRPKHQESKCLFSCSHTPYVISGSVPGNILQSDTLIHLSFINWLTSTVEPLSMTLLPILLIN